MGRKLAFGALLLALATLGGCFPVRLYQYEYVTYHSLPEAQAAQHRVHAEVLARIQPRPTPLVSECRFVIPPRHVVIERAVVTDEPGSQIARQAGELSYGEIAFMPELVRRRGSCARITFQVGTGGHVKERGEGAVLYLYSPEPGIADWYVVTPGNPPYELPVNLNVLEPLPRFADWLTRFEAQLVRGERKPPP